MIKQIWSDLSQWHTPLLTTLEESARRNYVPFHTPGHKKGRGAEAAFQQLLGKRVFLAE